MLLMGVLGSYHLCLLPSTLALCICLHLLIPNHTCSCILCQLVPIIAFYAYLCLHTYLLLSHLLVPFMATHALSYHLYVQYPKYLDQLVSVLLATFIKGFVFRIQ